MCEETGMKKGTKEEEAEEGLAGIYFSNPDSNNYFLIKIYIQIL